MARVAAVQMASGPNVSANLLEAARLIGMAVDGGADLIVLPENFAIIGMSETDKVDIKEQAGEGPIQEFLSQQSLKQGVWLVGGTIPLTATNDNKIRAASLLFDDKGQQQARYDKIHLFDVSLNEGQDNYEESLTIEPGDEIVVVETPFGKLGLGVCYDLRFPEQFRYMLDQGVEILALPAAFTAITGRAHWEVLVRARAIENLCYVVAAAQGGYHVNGRETHGDSMVVDSWGVILDRLQGGAGVVLGDLDNDKIVSTRRTFPAISHRKLHCEMK